MLRILVLGLLLALSVPVNALAADQANIFIYHRFGDSRYPSTNISLDDFAAHLQLLAEGDYHVMSLGAVVSAWQAGQTLPERTVVLTVDDAFSSFLSGAMPLLRRYGFPVTLFVNTDSVGDGQYLSWDQLRSLAAEGVEIGNHTASHLYLLNRRAGESRAQWLARLKADIERAQQTLTRELGTAPRLFAYPYGEYDAEVAGLIQQLGFAAAVAQQSGVATSGGNRYALPRFPMGGPYASLQSFREKLRMHPLPVTLLKPVSIEVGADNPPVLDVRIDPQRVDLRRLRCFVPGQADGLLQAVAGEPGHYLVQARAPLQGRRSKYTLTAPGRHGGWYWFSQLWVRTGQPEGY